MRWALVQKPSEPPHFGPILRACIQRVKKVVQGVLGHFPSSRQSEIMRSLRAERKKRGEHRRVVGYRDPNILLTRNLPAVVSAGEF